MSIGPSIRSRFTQLLVRVPSPKTKKLGPIALHAEQVAVLNTGRIWAGWAASPSRAVIHWFRQSGKTLIDAILGLYGLTADVHHTDRLVVVAASDEQQGLRVLEQCRRIASRHPLLSTIKFFAKEARYTTVERNLSTGGSHKSEHRLIVLASGDIRGAHGLSPSLTIIDELWTQDDYDLIEPLTQSPARACPLTVYCSYSGLRSQQKAGVPLYDLVERGKRGDDASFCYSFLGGQSGWSVVPWATPQWVERVCRQLATAPSRFARLIEDRVAAADDAFIPDVELVAAIDPQLVEPSQGVPGTRYSAGLDIGLTGAWTGLVLGHADTAGRFVLDVLRSWQGKPGAPVDLDAVEREILSLAARFPLETFRADPWQGVHLAQRLEKHGVPVHLAPVDAKRVDRLTTLIRQLFAQRLIKFSALLLPLREQLEGMTVRESKARGLLRFEGGGSTGAAQYSDLVFSLGLAAEGLEDAIGRSNLPEISTCIRSDAIQQPVRCYLWVPDYSSYVPSDPICRHCAAHPHLLARWRADSRGLDLRAYRARYGAPMPMSSVRRISRRESISGIGPSRWACETAK